jgi:Protein of unknown function (DUF3455)
MTKRLVTAAGAAVLLLAACASPPQVEVTDRLKPASNESLAMIVAAKGMQIYQCRAKTDELAAGYEWALLASDWDRAAGYEWTFVAPEAELFDPSDRTIGWHGAGAHWEAADGSRIRGAAKQRVAAPTPDAIHWLLLAAQPEAQKGVFSGITSVQRVNTVGGMAPANGCGRSSTGTSVRVDYTADYHFYRSKP